MGALGGIVIMMLLGFLVFGWVPGSTSRQAGDDQSKASLLEAFSDICVARFNADPDAAANLAALKATNSFTQGDYVEAGGWATMPGSDKPVAGVAKQCASELVATSP